MFCAVALTGLSSLYQDEDPDRALDLNPFNTDASIGRLVNGLTGLEGPLQLPALEQTGREAVRFSGINALTYGLLGEVYFGKGNKQKAEELFDIALSLSKTEANSLQRKLTTAIQEGDNAAAIANLDILLRRWPAQFPSFAPIIPSLLESSEGYDITLSTLTANPPWRPQFLRFLDNDPNTVGTAYRLQLDLGGSTEAKRQQEIGSTLSALLRNGHYNLAYRLFLLTLSEQDRAHYGYIFNSGFGLKPSGRPFDWTLRSDPAVKISRLEGLEPNESDARLAVEFLGKPVKNIRASQHLYLPAGQYRLTVNLDAANLKAPKGFYIAISCTDPRGLVTRLDIPTGSYRDRTLVTEFELPNNNCGVLRLNLGTDLIAESFRYRYSGTVYFHNIALRKVTS